MKANGSAAPFYNALLQATTTDEVKKLLYDFSIGLQTREQAFAKLQERVNTYFANPDTSNRNRLLLCIENCFKLIKIEDEIFAIDSVHPQDQKSLIHIKKKLVEEFKVSTTSELLVLDLACNAYLRSLRTSRIYNILLQTADVVEWKSQEKINFIKEASKSIDMANRQFLTALTYLKEIHQPPIKVKVQTNQAFIGQNQQFNKNA